MTSTLLAFSALAGCEIAWAMLSGCRLARYACPWSNARHTDLVAAYSVLAVVAAWSLAIIGFNYPGDLGQAVSDLHSQIYGPAAVTPDTVIPLVCVILYGFAVFLDAMVGVSREIGGLLKHHTNR